MKRFSRLSTVIREVSLQNLQLTPSFNVERITKKCLYCGKEFGLDKRRSITMRRDFCSHLCANSYINKKLHPGIFITCKQCGKKIRVSPSRKDQEFCSRRCQYNYHTPSIKCDYCGKEFRCERIRIEKYKKHFCSKICEAKSKIKREERICEVCGKSFFVVPSSKKKFCSYKCMGLAKVTKIKTNCDTCGKEIEKPKKKFISYKHHFCSRRCYFKWRKCKCQ